MASRAVALLALALCVAGAFAHGDHGHSHSDDPTESLAGVHDLTPETFDKFVNGAKHALVEFYAPWCGHCKRMTPEYKKLGELVAKDPALKARVVVAKVNADEHRSLGERFEVRGFPTLKFFPRGKAPSGENSLPYEGPRTSDAFVNFLKGKLSSDKGFARLAALDALAEKAGKATKDELKAIAKDLEAAAKKVAGDEDKVNAAVYTKLAKKALDKGVEYFKNEAARLDRMISSGSVASAKLEEMLRKASVLEAFNGVKLDGAAADEDDDDKDEE